MSCEEFYRPLHRYVEGECAAHEVRQIEQHLHACKECRRTLQMLRREVTMLEGYFDEIEVPEDVEERLRAMPAQPRRTGRWLPLAAAAAVVIGLSLLLSIQHKRVATIERVDGDVALIRADAAQPVDLSGLRNVEIYEGDQIATGEQHVAALEFADRTALEIDANTTIVFDRAPRGRDFRWSLPSGRLLCAIHESARGFEIKTPAGRVFGPPAGVHVSVQPLGTGSAAFDLFDVSQHEASTRWSLLAPAYAGEATGWRVVVTVLRGTVTVANGYGQRRVPEGTESEMTSSTRPTVPRSAAGSDVMSWARMPFDGIPDIETLLKETGPARTDAGRAGDPGATGDAPATPAGPHIQPPRNVTATVGLDRITIAWEPGTDATMGYDVYRRDELGGQFVKINAQPVKGTGYTDTSFSQAATYFYAVAAVRPAMAGAAAQPVVQAESRLSEAVRAEASDFTLVYTGGGPDMAIIIVRKFHRGHWRPSTFNVRTGETIGARRLMRLVDGLGGVEDVDYTTGYRLVAIEPVDDPSKPGTTCAVIEDAAGRRHKLYQQTPRKR